MENSWWSSINCEATYVRFFFDDGVAVVEVRLMYGELMKVELLTEVMPLPGGAAERAELQSLTWPQLENIYSRTKSTTVVATSKTELRRTGQNDRTAKLPSCSVVLLNRSPHPARRARCRSHCHRDDSPRTTCARRWCDSVWSPWSLWCLHYADAVSSVRKLRQILFKCYSGQNRKQRWQVTDGGFECHRSDEEPKVQYALKDLHDLLLHHTVCQYSSGKLTGHSSYRL